MFGRYILSVGVPPLSFASLGETGGIYLGPNAGSGSALCCNDTEGSD